jgi:hypothetical protein
MTPEQIYDFAKYVRKQERKRIVSMLQEYFELTRYSVEVENAAENSEWDAGFQSALALIKGESK